MIDRSRITPHIVPPARRPDEVPARVLAALPSAGVDVFTVPDDASDTAAFSARFGVGLDDCANTIVLKYRRDGVERHAAVVCLGSRRLDVNGAVRARLAAKKVSFAGRDEATALSGMEFGGITAFGLPADWPVLVDAAVMDRVDIVMGAGVRSAKLLLKPDHLAALAGVDVAALSSPA